MLNEMKINMLYKINFVSPFDSINGIYKVLGIYGYYDLLNNEVDIKKDLYDKLDIDQATFESHVDKFSSATFYKLVQLEDYPNTIYYVPDFIIAEEPNASLVKVYDLGITIKLGKWLDDTQIVAIKNEIEQLVLSRLGENQSAVIYTIGESIITETEWNTIKSNRNSNIEDSDTIYQRYLKLKQEVTKLQNKVDALEEIIVQLS